MVLHCSGTGYQWWNSQQAFLEYFCWFLYPAIRNITQNYTFQHKALDGSRVYGSSFSFHSTLRTIFVFRDRYFSCPHPFSDRPLPWISWIESQMAATSSAALYYRIAVLYIALFSTTIIYRSCWFIFQQILFFIFQLKILFNLFT